jgi:hypothetical protein
MIWKQIIVKEVSYGYVTYQLLQNNIHLWLHQEIMMVASIININF